VYYPCLSGANAQFCVSFFGLLGWKVEKSVLRVVVQAAEWRVLNFYFLWGVFSDKNCQIDSEFVLLKYVNEMVIVPKIQSRTFKNNSKKAKYMVVVIKKDASKQEIEKALTKLYNQPRKSSLNLRNFTGVLNLTEDPVLLQKKWRNEWK
jgi:hypothetical protein